MAEAELNKIYLLTNPLIGSSNSLASTLDTDEVIVEPTTNFKSSQQWFLTPTSYSDYYRLHTSQKNSSFALDIRGYEGTDKQILHFHDVMDAYFGQYWRIDPWGDGTAKLSNNFTGDSVLLDVNDESDGKIEPLLSNLDEKKKGQHWKFEIVGSGEPDQPITPTAKPTETSPSSSTLTPAPTSDNGEGGKKLATPAIAGIAVGGAVALILAVVLFISWRKKWLCFGNSGGGTYSSSQDRRPQMGLSN